MCYAVVTQMLMNVTSFQQVIFKDLKVFLLAFPRPAKSSEMDQVL